MGVETERKVRLHSRAGEDVLFIRRMSGHEELSRCYELVLSCYSRDHDISMEQVLGEHATVELTSPGVATRLFDGIVCELSHEGAEGRYALYRMVLRPWLWLLTRGNECRVADQDRTSIELIEERFKKRGFSEFSWQLSRTYEPRKFCVQYRESDFAFVSRLLEEEGIYYYFTHALGSHQLVLTDSSSTHQAAPGFERIYFGKLEDIELRVGMFFDWRANKRVRAGQVTLTDYDYEKPRSNLQSRSANPKQHMHAEADFFDYPGRYVALEQGEYRARVRLEELHASYELAGGSTDSTGLSTGHVFELLNHPREDQNKQYLIVGASYDLDTGAFESGAEAGGDHFTTTVQVLDARTQFRPRRATPWPTISGAQTAVVVGPKGHEIWTDHHGRVRVQFHWDREHASDEKSSCWIRVAQPWAGKGWGAIQIPRIGHEVVVEFLEGDPDHPLITGSVYNNDNKAPYSLPKNQTRSGLKTQSSMGAALSDYNELRFEDKKGQEDILLRAARDRTTKVRHDHRATIGHDHAHDVANNLTVTVGADSALLARNIQEIGKSEIRMQVGGSKIVVTPDSIILFASGCTVVLGPGGVVVNGTTVNLNPPGFTPPLEVLLPNS